MMTSCLRLGLTLTTTRRSSATSRLVSVHANAPRPGGNGETRAPDPGAPGGPEKDEGEAFRRWLLDKELLVRVLDKELLFRVLYREILFRVLQNELLFRITQKELQTVDVIYVASTKDEVQVRSIKTGPGASRQVQDHQEHQQDDQEQLQKDVYKGLNMF